MRLPPRYNRRVGKEVVVGITGASGAIYAVRLLKALETSPEVATVHLVVTRHGRVAMAEELGGPHQGALDLKRLLGVTPERVRVHDNDAVAALIASGSHRTAGMVVIPCSAGTLAKIAAGVADNLLTRAADVHLKEGRKLLLVLRETPLSRIHLKNCLAAAEAGATILPPMPSFYTHPRDLGELVDQFVARVLDHLGLEHEIGTRWGE